MDSLIYPPMPILPIYDLSSYIPSKRVKELKRIKVGSKRDLEPRKSDSLMNLEPWQYLSEYTNWLKTLKGIFEEVQKISKNFRDYSPKEITDFCVKMDEDFSKNYQTTRCVRTYLESIENRANQNILFRGADASMLFVPSNVSAMELALIHFSRASLGDRASQEYLDQKFYLGLDTPFSFRGLDRVEIQKITALLTKKYYDKIELIGRNQFLSSIDEILSLDNREEIILWKMGNQRLVFIDLYLKLDSLLQRKNCNSSCLKGDHLDTDKLLLNLKARYLK